MSRYEVAQELDPNEAVEIESLLAVEQFIARSKLRDWSPDDLDVDEIREYGHLLSPETITIAEAFMGVEAELPFYLTTGDRDDWEKRLKDVPSEVLFGDRWGDEEGRHKPTLAEILFYYGVRTREEIAAYNKAVLQHGWSPTDHQGLNSLVGARVYRMFQERATYVNYRGLLSLIRQDYGLPQDLTAKERSRGRQIGAAEAVDTVSMDEQGHFVINFELVKIHLKYFPEETKKKIREVHDGFKMPSLRFLPNQREFVQALRNTHIYSGNIFQEQVAQPTLRSLGLT